MTKLIWNNIGERYFEVGVDRGVLYTSDGTGVSWNGLISVSETPSGGETTPYYLDGVKYLNVANRKEFRGTLEAYTYPDEFSEYDGWTILDHGISVDEQKRKAFGLSYRTRIGNDLDGQDYGYKIHLVYNALAIPTEKAYSSLGDDLDPLTFSWSFTSTPIRALSNPTLVPSSHITIDSTKTNQAQLAFIEDYLYGTSNQPARLPTLDQLIILFENPVVPLMIDNSIVTSISPLIETDLMNDDLTGRLNEGIYLRTDGSRLTESTTPGLYVLEP